MQVLFTGKAYGYTTAVVAPNKHLPAFVPSHTDSGLGTVTSQCNMSE